MTVVTPPVRRTQHTGVVVAARRMKRTVTVEVQRVPWHARLRKQYRQTQRFLVDDPKEEAAVGDHVLIEETRPLSRRKHFRLVRILERTTAPAHQTPTAHQEGKPSVP